MNETIIGSYVEAKRALGEATGASETLLHVHLGLLIFVLTALVVPRHTRSLWPLLTVLLLAVANELMDYAVPGPWSPWRSAADVANTVFWPLLLFVIAQRGSGCAGVPR